MSPISRVRRTLARAKREALRGATHAGTSTLDAMRRGHRTVVMTPRVGLRLGNFLYLWMRAHHRTAAGSPTAALVAPGMQPWLDLLPELRGLSIDRSDMRFSDRREWDDRYLYQRFGVDFDAEQVDAFARDALVPHLVPDRSGTVVVNVRRGDYYTDFRDKYSFDQAGYIEAALELVGPAERILVVSDDPAWCSQNLDELLRASSADVEYAETDPWSNFVAVAQSARIIGANSTFSYWAGHAATVLHDDALVIMPRFHGRMGAGRTDAHQLDPRWTAIEGFH